MSRFWDRWATNYRNWRVVLVGLLLLPVLIWALVTNQRLGTNRLLTVGHETAIVTRINEIDTSELHSKLGSDVNIYQGFVELADGSEIELGFIPPIPKVGDGVPILVEQYDDGKIYYRIDRQEWQMSGPK
ncbi:MAG: hypothetical protein OES46_03975 [Gammaproteobacteria bacterium]|nr:hypothetical protein [Gammaproteobacteria bacterium]